jgi:DNA-binding transcriptional ArsR family regulator
MVKFKVAFTIDAKTLFAYLSQALPTLENLHVEEVIERVAEKPKKIEKKLLSETQIKMVKKYERKYERKKFVSKGRKFNLDQGINRILVEVLSDGKLHSADELVKAISATMYSSNSVQSRLASLKEYGVIINPEKGKWQLMPEYLRKNHVA